MTYPIADIEGIGPKFAEKLSAAGLKKTGDFLDKCGDKKGRKAVAVETEISEKLLLKWANMADLMRIKGVGPQFAELLEGAGVDTVKELRNRNATNLTKKMAEVQEEKKLTKAAPAESIVQGWVDEAKGLEPKISH